MTATGYRLPTPYRRPDGRWTAQLSLGILNGKRQRKTVYGATQRECREKLIAALTAQATDSLTSLDERTTLAPLLDRWLDTIGPSLRPRTRRNYADHIRLHIAPALGPIRATKLTARDVQTFLNERSASGLSPKTVRHLRATLRAGLQWAMDERLVVRNVAAGRHIRLPQLEARTINHDARAGPARPRNLGGGPTARAVGRRRLLRTATGRAAGAALVEPGW
jgi:integrase